MERLPGPEADRRVNLQIIASVAAFWTLSDLAYYLGLPLLGRAADYNRDPFAISLFYLFWVGASLILFWPVYLRWGLYAPWPTFGRRWLSLLLWTLFFAAAVWFTGYVMPTLSPADWPADWGTAPDIGLATQLYFLPKSLEILFQQLLVVALILALVPFDLGLRWLCLTCALLFGGAHLLLFFSNLPVQGVIRFTLFSTVFGGLMPIFVLHVRNGLAIAYVLHWSYYAVTILMLRLFGPGMTGT